MAPRSAYRKRYRRRTKKRAYRRKGIGRAFGRIRGRGDFWSTLKGVGSTALKAVRDNVRKGTSSNIGRQIGSAYGGDLGGAAGGYLGQQFANITGVGDYSMRMRKLPMGTPVPSFGSMASGVIISHREYLGDLVSQGTGFYNTSVFPIQPGSSSTFPWLSTVASSFEMYEIIGCVFEFKSTSSEFSSVTGGALGSIILATDYNSSDNNFTSKQAMENAQFTVSAKPSESVIHPVECDPKVNAVGKILYIRTGPVPANQDLKLYDMGRFQIATSGVQASAGTVLGEIWCSYKIKLYKPTIENVMTGMSHIIVPAASISSTNWFGTTKIVPQVGSSLDLSVINNAISLPQVVGVYLINISLAAASAITAAPTLTYSNCSAALVLANDGSGYVGSFQTT